jgi:hypothetical protein
LFDLARQQDLNEFGGQVHSTIEKGHGGIEIRRYSVMGNTEPYIPQVNAEIK